MHARRAIIAIWVGVAVSCACSGGDDEAHRRCTHGRNCADAGQSGGTAGRFNASGAGGCDGAQRCSSDAGQDAGDAQEDAGDAGPSEDARDATNEDAGNPDAADGSHAQDGGDSGTLCGAGPDTALLGNHRDADCNAAFEVTQVVAGASGILYLVSLPRRLVYAWSAVSGTCAVPIPLGPDPVYVTYSRAHDRLFVAYANKTITSVNPATGAEQPFAIAPHRPTGLAAVGRYIMVSDQAGPFSFRTHYTFAPDGARVSVKEYSYTSEEYDWSDINQRLYFTRDSTPRDVHFESIDCTTGAFTGQGESEYHGAFDVHEPVRVSPDGARVLVAGEVYDGLTLKRLVSVPGEVHDAAWLSSDRLVVLRESNGAAILEQRSGSHLRLENVQRFDGTPVALRAIGNGAVVVTNVGGVPTLSVYHANSDGDADGVVYTSDAFPLDRAASQDSDSDGHPDRWNAGGGSTTTGLTLDAFPADSACHTAAEAHVGDPNRCDVARSIPSYTPDGLIFDGADIVYLISRNARKLYRYSTTLEQPLNPLVFRREPQVADLSVDANWVYVGYGDGAIVSKRLGGGPEFEFTVLPYAVHGLASAGRFLLAADTSGPWNSHFTFDASGREIIRKDWNEFSREYAWSLVTSRMYFFRDNTSPNDIHFEVVDQTSGQITSDGESPYHGDYDIKSPIRVSRDGAYVLLGSGDIYDGFTLRHAAKLPVAPIDAVWLPGNALVAFTADGILRWFSSSFAAGKTVATSGTPLRVFAGPSKLVVVTLSAGKPVVQLLPY